MLVIGNYGIHSQSGTWHIQYQEEDGTYFQLAIPIQLAVFDMRRPPKQEWGAPGRTPIALCPTIEQAVRLIVALQTADELPMTATRVKLETEEAMGQASRPPDYTKGDAW